MSLKLNAICLNCSLVLTFMLMLQVSFAQYNFTQVDALLEAKKKLLGGKLIALVSKDGKIIYQKEIGEDFKVESPEPIGAGSKWLTAALIMTFVDKGELSLDDPVSNYLPIYASYSKSYITLRHCLAEITGIESEQKKITRVLQKKKFASLEEEVNHFASRKDIVTNPGKEFFYGEVGYNIAGRVLEVIAKRKTFSKLMQERITRPLGMKKTSFVTKRGAEDPSAGAISTAGDYTRFMTMILNNGEYNGKRILSKEAVAEMEKIPANALPVKSSPKTTQDFSYGFGAWIQETDKNGKAIVISAPGINGTWPYIDRCGNYTCIIFTRQLDTEQNQQLFLEIKNEVEKLIKPQCN